jgi:8-oxo-dGTP pyrophosphatase MutT (NUDIX family)
VSTALGDSVQVVLLCKRTQDAPTDPGKWSFFGGTREELDGGDPARTAVREVAEELTVSIDVDELEYVERFAVPADPETFHVEIFASELRQAMDTLTLRRAAPGEIVEGEGLAWFTAEETRALDLRATDRKALAAFFGQRKKCGADLGQG